ncbi:NRDE family protein [Alkalihalobacillus sp. CinArs1]|uniref:NRDE family protein n=1 Tax=Alkalihalobacillus sp. CinArs1 TaxID=2995314 RepID=UPI0022DD79CC|nr:NRDE family protein [Alkalihalobacillus sp. CinArs1]
MCLIAVAIDVNRKYPFILIANRDEFYERPTERAHYWTDYTNLLAGRDLRAKGTWLGITTEGNIAALTNFREPNEDRKERSRGELPVNYLTQSIHPYDYLKSVQEQKDHYNGFNLFVGNVNEFFYYSNRENEVRKVESGIHAVSNHLLNTSWPKVDRIKRELSDYLDQTKEIDSDQLFKLLDHAEPAPDKDLPNTGIPLEWERLLSPIYIKSEKYGTRAQTIVMVSNEGEVTFLEKATGEKINKFHFSIDCS